MHRLKNHVLFLGYSEEESAEKETLSPKLIVYDAISRVESDKVYDDIEFFSGIQILSWCKRIWQSRWPARDQSHDPSSCATIREILVKKTHPHVQI